MKMHSFYVNVNIPEKQRLTFVLLSGWEKLLQKMMNFFNITQATLCTSLVRFGAPRECITTVVNTNL